MGDLTLVALAEAAGVSRGVARSCVDRGYLPRAGYGPADIVLLRVAAACLAFPDPVAPPPVRVRGRSPRPAEPARPGKRDTTALRFARAALTDPSTTIDTVLVLAGTEVEVCSGAELATLLARLGPRTATVLPLGVWRALLPAERRTPLPAVPVASRRDPATLGQVLAGIPRLAPSAMMTLEHPAGEPW